MLAAFVFCGKYSTMNINQLESYNLDDAVKFHDHLNPLLWDRTEHLKPEIQEHLLKIAEDFAEFLGVDPARLQDITLSGSNAAYNYTPSSDIDLHLVVDIPNDEVYRELFDAKKTIYNSEHSITVKGIPVELYAQATDQAHHSQGIYSILHSEWVQIPRRRKADIDDVSVRSKFEDFERRASKAIKSNSAEAIDQLLKKIRAMRQAGLDAHGEFGAENLAFKLLRNTGTIQKLRDCRQKIRDQELSLKELDIKESVTYGYGRDYLAEVGLTPDGVSASTCQFANETSHEHPRTDREIIEDFVAFCSKMLNLESAVNLKIKRDPQWSVRNKTFGRYDNDRGVLEVAVGQRHIMDVLRTVAHELTHQRQHETKVVPPDAGADGSPFENEANASAGVLMRLYGKRHPELFSYTDINESSGYIPTAAEANDPRFEMALSVDVRPGALGKAANALDLNTDSQGHPQLLRTDGHVQRMMEDYRKFKA